jgi:hypothetical protein
MADRARATAADTPRATPDDLPARLAALFDARAVAPPDRVLRLAGLDIGCACRASGYLAHVDRALPAAPDGTVPGVHITVEARDAETATSWPAWPTPHYREREVEAALADTPYRLHFHDTSRFWQVYDRRAARGLQLMAADDGYPDWDPAAPLRNFIHWVLADRGGGLVHAGTLGVAGRGVLLAGPGGSGKSGAVLAGLLHGLQSAGDDYVAVVPGPTGMTAHRAFETLKQDPAGLDRLGVASPAGRDGALNWQGKHVFTLPEIGRPPLAASLHLAAVCLPHVARARRTTFTPVAARDAFLALAPSAVTQIPAARPETFRLGAAVCRALPAWRVALGSDPAEIADAFARFIKGLSP